MGERHTFAVLAACSWIDGVVTGRLTVLDAHEGLMRTGPGHEAEPG